LGFNSLRAEESREKVEKQDELKVERIGGFGGFGLPGSHLKSKGGVFMSDLSSNDVVIINSLFQGSVHLDKLKTDGFLYRITRKIGNNLKTIEIPEENIPMSIRKCVKDTLE
jgi:hypothetical protein